MDSPAKTSEFETTQMESLDETYNFETNELFISNRDTMLVIMNENPDVPFSYFVSLFCDKDDISRFIRCEQGYFIAYLSQKNTLDKLISKSETAKLDQTASASMRCRIRDLFAEDRTLSQKKVRKWFLEKFNWFTKNNCLDLLLPYLYQEVREEIDYDLKKILGLKKF